MGTVRFILAAAAFATIGAGRPLLAQYRAPTRPVADPRLAHRRLHQQGNLPGAPVFLRRPPRETGRGAEGLAILGETMGGGKGRSGGIPDPGGRTLSGPPGRDAAAGSHRPSQLTRPPYRRSSGERHGGRNFDWLPGQDRIRALDVAAAFTLNEALSSVRPK